MLQFQLNVTSWKSQKLIPNKKNQSLTIANISSPKIQNIANSQKTLPQKFIATRCCVTINDNKLIKVKLAFTSCFSGLAGFFNSDEGPVEEGYDDTKPDGSHPAIMGWS